MCEREKNCTAGYTGESRKGKAHRGFVISIRHLQMGLARSLQPSEVSGVHMETPLSELLVQAPQEGSLHLTVRVALSYRRWLCLCSSVIMKGSRHPGIHIGRDQLREQRGHPWSCLLFASGALLSNDTLFPLEQELREKSLLWGG